ncbi:hypothetical protein J6Z19_06280 [bacterium]|nr:hypothetical protein [bacterium]
MKRFVTQNRILAVFVSALLLPVLLVAVTESELDDVAAMITVAKKAANTIFILDTSENMNSFAYSDYIETCADAYANAEHAHEICLNSLEQCLEVKDATDGFCGSVDCTQLANGCDEIKTTQKRVENYCNDLKAVYAFMDDPDHQPENRQLTRSGTDPKRERFVGPWNPDSFYTQDLCFYDWTNDTNGDVLNGTTSEHWSNPSCDYDPEHCHNVGTSKEKDPKGATLSETAYYGSDRRDWDCITDGNDNMDNGQSFSSLKGGVSGHWLNWRYATSLDAVKILLANVHQFSYPPRWRGENKCIQYNYKPVKPDITQCEEGYTKEVVNDATGEVRCKDSDGNTDKSYYKKICFISPEPTNGGSYFDTAYLDKEDEERSKILNAMRTLVSGSWSADDKGEHENEVCANYDLLADFSFYDKKDGPGLHFDKGTSAHPAPVSAETAGCHKCMKFNGDTEDPAFEEMDCEEFEVDAEFDNNIPREQNFDGEYTATYSQKCCKTSKCTNPKCRDNDLCCKNNSTAYPDETSEGYKTCLKDGEYQCNLGFYSEFDQDKTHCCGSVECVNGETIEEYLTDTTTGCQICSIGSVMTEKNETSTFVSEPVLPNPGAYMYDENIEFKVKIASMDGGDNIEDMTVTLYYACNNDTDSWHEMASFTCYRDSDPDCEDYYENDKEIMTPKLSGCETEGYKVKLEVSTTGRYCKIESSESFSVSFKYELPEGNFSGKKEWQKVLDPTQDYYMILKNQAGGDQSVVVHEYECKQAFYHTQAYTDSSSCPRDANKIVQKFHEKGYTDVKYCDPDYRREEVIMKQSGCGFEISYFCSYLCRDEVTYNEPWACMATFFQMDEYERGGIEKCSQECQRESYISPNPSGGKTNNVEECCRCIDRAYYYEAGWYQDEPFFEPVQGVSMPDAPGSSTKKTYHCAVSAIKGSDTQVGFHAEIINGHTNEVMNSVTGQYDGTYLLSPYVLDDETLFSPYDEWISARTFIETKSKDLGIRDTTISGFKTSSSAERRNVCIYDLLDDWGGDLCSICSTVSCGNCLDPSISVPDDKCTDPNFWMKVPRSEGGELIFSKEQIVDPDSRARFQKAIKELKAVGGPTLGETLYDAWRFLGGMYALHDPKHVVGSEEGPYESPFANQEPECFSNEVVVLSGGQAQFDHNNRIEKVEGINVTCPSMSQVSEIPCVAPTEDDYYDNSADGGRGGYVNRNKPYYETDWYQSSIMNVARFVKTHSFYNTNENCVKTDQLKRNILGYEGDPDDTKCMETIAGEGNNKAVINRIHSGAIGEWTLSALYNKPDFEYLEKITKKYPTDDETATDGKYCSLTLGKDSVNDCSFRNITDLLSDLLTLPQPTDVESGRPHWTSSLVQPFDVEEKYRGPEAYVAGAVPIASATSRFWFGNLKKYMVDEGNSDCNKTISCEGYAENNGQCGTGCGGWQKQTFASSADCFVDNDNGVGDMPGDDSEDFRRLLAGGAARKLSDKLRTETCSNPPCFKKVSTRTIYYDADNAPNTDLKLLKDISDGDMSILLDEFGLTGGAATAEKIFDYMYGYDSFADNVDQQRKLRFGYDNSPTGTSITVRDPLNIDFNNKKYVTIRPVLLGAIVHSKPVAVYYGNNTKTRIFAGANDGMLHAFDESGNEQWAYIPSNVLPSVRKIANNSNSMNFKAMVDGPITFFHIDQSHDGIVDEGEKAFLIFGYRRGAKGYTVIDVSEPDSPKFVQNINTNGGYSFGKALIFRKCPGVCNYAEELDYYLAVPGGYDDCEDGDDPDCKMPEDSSNEGGNVMKGNKFAIYPFNKEQNKFSTSAGSFFNYERDSEGETNNQKKWLVASFAAEPFAINTKGKRSINTEFVYFTDLTGTVFRVDVRDGNIHDWKDKTKVVFAKRNSAGDTGGVKLFEQGKSYAGNNLFPPLEIYNPGGDNKEGLVPIPVVFGDASWPKIDTEKASMTIFYDKQPKEDEDYQASYSGYNSNDYETADLNNNNQFHSGKSGWRIDFGGSEDSKGEKGITEPMILYDLYGSNGSSDTYDYSLAWNTYVPKKSTDCMNFGTSFNYDRHVVDGSNILKLTEMSSTVGEWDPSKCKDSSTQGISVATAVGVVATSEGYDLAFGAGADIYRKPGITVVISTTRVLKWYELY